MNRIHRTTTAALTAAATLAATASAAAPTGLDASFSPNTTSTGTRLTVTLGGSDLAAAQAGRQVSAVKVTAPRGLKFDRRGVKTRCTAQQAAAKACPSGSAAGSGTATFATALGEVTASLKVFVTDPIGSGDLAGIQILATALGSEFALPARVLPPRGSRGPVLSVDDIATAAPVRVTLKALSLKVRASTRRTKTVTRTTRKKVKVNGRTRTKTVRRKVKVKVTVPLLRTPSTCPSGGWTSKATVAFTGGGTLALDATSPCRRRKR